MICSKPRTIIISRETQIPIISFKSPRKNSLNFSILHHLKALTLSTRPIMANQMVPAASSSLILTSGASGRISALFSLRALKSLLTVIQAFIILLLVPFRGKIWTVAINSADKGSRDDHKQDSVCPKSPMVRIPTTIMPWRSSSFSSSVGNGAVDQDGATRRALAIQRVLQEDDETTRRDFSFFVGARGDSLFTQSWTPVSGKIRGLVVLLHGLNEHSSRYSSFSKQLNSNGFKVYGMDWIGHGGSDGLHAYIHSLDHAVDDTKLFIEKVLAENPGLPCFCFGHSTGGAIILKAMLDPKLEASVAGVVLTSPAVGVQPSHPIYAVLAPIVSFLIPRYQISTANKKGMPVSRDPEALVAKYSDPLVYTGPLRVRTGYEILRISSYLQQNLNRLKVPFFVLHGTDDTVTDPEASKKLYEEASSTDKGIKLLDGYLHDLLFELERDAIVDEIIEWLNSRV